MWRRTEPIRIVYFGTPEYAVPTLTALAGDERFKVALVVTQPDRGRQTLPPAVKTAALALDLPVYQPETLRSPDARLPLQEARADLFVVAAYGLIFGLKTLAIPRLGCLNLHASLLPRFRGASPISAAILAGDPETGVTLMKMDAGMDTGDILATRAAPIGTDDTTGSLTARLADLGADLAVSEIPRWVSGGLTARPQPSRGASLTRPLVKADGWIDWSRPAVVIERLVRAMQPWPRAWTTTPNGLTVQVLRSSVVDANPGQPGEVLLAGKEVVVRTGESGLRLLRVQPAGRGQLDGYALIQGRQASEGDLLGRSGGPVEAPPPMVVEAPVR